MDWDPPKPKSTAITIGDDLTTLSVAELTARIDLLRAEIERTEAMSAEKRRVNAAADALFSKPD